MSRLSLYRWQAVNGQQQLHEGQLLAADEESLLRQLAEQDLLPISWQRRKTWRARDWKWQQKIDLVRQLATLLKAGLPLAQGLALLSQGHPHPGWQLLLHALRLRILRGEPFSQALSQWPQIFPPLFAALMQVGELTGQLDVCCAQLADQQARQQHLWNKVIKALRYPLFILLVAVAVSVGMLLFVLPEFVSVYASFNAPLPAFTAAVMALSVGLQRWGGWLAVALLLSAAAWRALRRRSPAWQLWEQRLMLRLPLLSDLWRGSQLSQIYAVLQLTQRAGITLLQGLQAAEATLTTRLWRDAVVALQHHIAQGEPLHQAMQDHPLFTPLCMQLVHVGEEAGALDTMLARLAEWHEAQTLTLADTLASSLEPAMMVIVGAIVGTLVIAMYLPVFGLGNVIH
ncbi:MAG: protein transport protein HofC [Pantoea sp.]|uniref:protein transport protein HofC n=1 Tax=Pantoea septica TaxID=472695 RepID=UPI001C123666|nr:protein transport protein HofC [Pantoea septica]MBU5377855.1 protein transport protein HofC [Pantoea septica]MDU6440116.1 protein transport protein HofC [Pantoea sp.]